jgi:hypothetical protein
LIKTSEKIKLNNVKISKSKKPNAGKGPGGKTTEMPDNWSKI